ncbi:helix-turn-helix domain-containing protein [Salegentibacter mishustinae]|jgi:transcriptional regulator with XRE-family HTH domain|uniref:helix-turn-helix domain-containing protein n=1 Tax=Salegentibacter mishustinae TaxID=270918 RepID=UPI001CE06933|nr:helix-turn-helix transcriptional regulator [Salegentibacter mishustinae]UBZ08614.1 helix-turn-helix domain-containing protein [Salegentibacter mishustinae]
MESDNSNLKRLEIAERLKKARELSGLSQAQVALKLKVQRPAISEIEAGRRKVSAEEIIEFSKLYKVDSSWLLKEDDNSEITQGKLKFAARALSKMSEEDKNKLFELLNILPK